MSRKPKKATVQTSTATSHNDGSHAKKTFSSRVISSFRRTGVVVVIIAVFLKFAFENATFLNLFDDVLTSFQETKEHLAHHIYLHGNYAPVAEEHYAVPLEVVEGTALPNDLDGLYIRNGPNPIPTQITKRYHWFDGHGMLHSVRIQSKPQPSATYSNQYIPTPRYDIERRLGREIFSHVGEFTGVTGLIKALVMNTGKAKAFGLSTLTNGQANTQTIMYNNKFLCGHESSLPFEVQLDQDGRIVKAIGFEDFGGVLNYPVSAHPKKDPITGNFLFHGYTGDPSLVKRYGPLKVGEYDPNRNKLLYYQGAIVNDQNISFAHDMLFTKNWLVVFRNSVLFDPSKILEPDFGFFGFNRDIPLRIGLVPRTAEQESHNINSNQTAETPRHVVWVDTGAPHSIVHPLAAWEEKDGTVVIWSPIGDDFDGSLSNTSTLNVFHMTEFRLDPKSHRLISKKVIDAKYNVEFSRMRDDCLGRFCRFGYTSILDQGLGGDGLFSGFTVWDMERGVLHKAVLFGSGNMGQDPVIIPKPGRDRPEAVYMATFLYNDNDKQSYFVLYDGEKDYNVVTKLRIPHRVPFGFHGQWVSGDELRAHIDYHASKSQT